MDTYLQEEFEMLMEVASVLPGTAHRLSLHSYPWLSTLMSAPKVIATAWITVYVWSFLLVALKVEHCACWRMDLFGSSETRAFLVF
jgi:hypothetical protein